MASAIARSGGGEPLSHDEALALAEAGAGVLPDLMAAAAAVRDRRWGKTVTYSPKVFLPLTNLCRNRCDYCSFRRSAGDPGEWTMTPDELGEWLDRARAQGCVEALFCLGDKPESSFPSFRRTLQTFGHESTVDYLERASRMALDRGLLPHTNAGILSADDMRRLKPVNVSLGLMLENVSPRLCEPGMPHHKAPDKRPARRMKMLREAGELRIPFTTGILLGIGETRRERVESLLAIRDLHREYGHIQEVIVQNFRAQPGVPMEHAPEPDDVEVAHSVALARLVLDPDVGVQAPPNLNPASAALLLRAGINDFGGISPVSPDYINRGHPWPHIEALSNACDAEGFTLKPRLAVYPAYADRPEWVAPALSSAIQAAEARVAQA
jgi:FO synthase